MRSDNGEMVDLLFLNCSTRRKLRLFTFSMEWIPHKTTISLMVMTFNRFGGNHKSRILRRTSTHVFLGDLVGEECQDLLG